MNKVLQLLVANYVKEYHHIPYELSDYSSTEIEECIKQLTASGLLSVWSTPIYECEYADNRGNSSYTTNTVSVSAYISPENYEKLKNL